MAPGRCVSNGTHAGTPRGCTVPPMSHTPTVYTSAEAPSPSERRYLVEGMSCDHCKDAITAEVTQVPGVTGVEVDLDAKVVRVQGDDADGAAVVAAIDEAGYDAVAA
jgi:copper chaperone